MIWLLYALAAVPLVLFGPFVVLWLRFVVAINYERGGWWRVLVPLVIGAGWLDIRLNYTTFSLLMWDRPRAGEYTISKHLERLVTWQNKRGAVARYVCKYFVNPWDKVGPPHVTF